MHAAFVQQCVLYIRLCKKCMCVCSCLSNCLVWKYSHFTPLFIDIYDAEKPLFRFRLCITNAVLWFEHKFSIYTIL